MWGSEKGFFEVLGEFLVISTQVLNLTLNRKPSINEWPALQQKVRCSIGGKGLRIGKWLLHKFENIGFQIVLAKIRVFIREIALTMLFGLLAHRISPIRDPVSVLKRFVPTFLLKWGSVWTLLHGIWVHQFKIWKLLCNLKGFWCLKFGCMVFQL